MSTFVAGHEGMVGSAIMRRLVGNGHTDIITATRGELDLLDQAAVREFFERENIHEVYLAAAKVGGIHANDSYPAEFISNNLLLQVNIIMSAFNAGVRKLLFLGSSCIYPKLALQPMSEDLLLSGWLEPTNEPYAVAKIAGIKMCESYNRQYGVDYRSVMPTNLYGENDNFHPQNAHVIPAMMRRFHQAKRANSKEVVVWGTGTPKREFLHVDDMASGCIHVMNLPHDKFQTITPDPMCSHINIGTGRDVSIRELAETMAKVVGFKGDLVFDSSMPDGTPRKLLDVSRLLSSGWAYSIELSEGLTMTYEWFLENLHNLRG